MGGFWRVVLGVLHAHVVISVAWIPYQALGCLNRQELGWLNRQDLSRGMEPIPIPMCDSNADMAPFRYMAQSRVHDKASLNLSLFSPKLGFCCNCETRDCLTSLHSCECGRASGGDIAYTEGGILKDHFLDQGAYNSSIKTKKSSSSNVGVGGRVFYGKQVSRTFIRECSVRCGCHSECGNRVVQQGMKYGVEVFQTKNTGWGVRARMPIPKGAFVFELVGEILTNAEMMLRGLVSPTGSSFAIQLDADEATEAKLDDNSALCLDSSFFGNVARFLNHRFAIHIQPAYYMLNSVVVFIVQ